MPEILQEKMYEWTEDKIRWYQDACLYPENNRDQVIVEALLKYMNKADTLCDLGCGIGHLSIALSTKVKKVIAIDQNPAALHFLQKQIAAMQLDNIEIMEGSYRSLDPDGPPCQAALLCMAGRLEDHLQDALNWAEKRLFFITGTSTFHSFKPRKRKDTYESPERIRSYLAQCGMTYLEETLNIRFGQPLRSKEEAVAFISCYNREGTLEEIEADLKEKLIATADQNFPWYYPCDKCYKLFVIER